MIGITNFVSGIPCRGFLIVYSKRSLASFRMHLHFFFRWATDLCPDSGLTVFQLLLPCPDSAPAKMHFKPHMSGFSGQKYLALKPKIVWFVRILAPGSPPIFPGPVLTPPSPLTPIEKHARLTASSGIYPMHQKVRYSPFPPREKIAVWFQFWVVTAIDSVSFLVCSTIPAPVLVGGVEPLVWVP